MANTDFILSRLRLTLALQRVIRFGVEAAAIEKLSCKRLVPLVEVRYTGFNLPIRLRPQPLSPAQKIRNTLGRWTTLVSRKISVLKQNWIDSAWSRIALHGICCLRNGHFRWHWAGILRELRPMFTPAQLSPVRRPSQALAG